MFVNKIVWNLFDDVRKIEIKDDLLYYIVFNDKNQTIYYKCDSFVIQLIVQF